VPGRLIALSHPALTELTPEMPRPIPRNTPNDTNLHRNPLIPTIENTIHHRQAEKMDFFNRINDLEIAENQNIQLKSSDMRAS
jgi:hypothetical protein